MQILVQNLVPESQVESTPEPQNELFLFDINYLFEDFVYILNYFALAWSIFFTVVYLIDFFNARVFNSGAELAVEKIGIRGIKMALRLWYRYYFALFCLVLFSLFRQSFLALPLSLLTIFAIFYKIWQDIIEMMDIIGYFKMASSIASAIQSSLSFKK
jgi:hypothetical protein